MGWLENLLTHKKNNADNHAKELYERIVEYSIIKSTSELNSISVKDSHGDSGLEKLLEFCAILYRPENSHYYMEPFNNGIDIPEYLPQNYSELIDNCVSLCYGMMLGSLSGQDQYLEYPDLVEMGKNADQLCLEECMQFFLYYNRLLAKFGQKLFFEKWKDGTTLRVVKRMQQLQKNS